MLLLFTMFESYIATWFSCYYSYDPYTDSFTAEGYRIVSAAAAMTVAITAAVTAYAWTTKTDFTAKWGMIWVFGMTMMMMSLFMIFFNNYILDMVFCALGVLLFGIYLIFDTQLVLGQGRHALSIDDYIIGAMLIYADIIMIFIYLL